MYCRDEALERISRSRYQVSTVDLAKELLGCRLVRVSRGRRMAGKIVEVEAYRGFDDSASHAFKGLTRANAAMFGEAGHAYVYFTYGFHHCLNVTTEAAGVPGAILIRALEPVEGIDLMRKHRRKGALEQLASGPGKLTQALDIDRRLNGVDLANSGELFIEGRGRERQQIATSSRIGLSSGMESPWRFFVAESRFVSKAVPQR